MKRLSEHYESIGETYLRHMWEAVTISVMLIIAAFACLIHALLPFVFKTTASSIIKNIINDLEERKK